MKFAEYNQLLAPVIILNKEHEIVYYNFICSTFFHSSPRKLGKITSLTELFAGIDLNIEEILSEVEESDSFVITPEVTFQNTDGESVTVIIKFVPIEEGTLVTLLDFSIEKRLHDKYKDQIKELRDTHEQIVKADKLTALGEVIAGIGHEISTPLVIMNNRLENLQEHLSINDIDKCHADITKLNTEFNRIVKIFSGLKSIVKNQEDQNEIVDLSKVTSDVINFISDLSSARNVSIETSKSHSSHWVMGNEIKLQQVLINLVKNSLQSLQDAKVKDPKVVIEVFYNESTQTQNVKVIDNGPGVPTEIQDKIFDMFYTSKDIVEGTGLGLSISRKIIEALSGSLRLNETKAGCEFEFEVPSVEMGSFAMTNRYLSGESDIEDQKVLIIGDNIDELNSIYRMVNGSEFVSIFTNDEKKVDSLIEFLLIDTIIFLNNKIQFNDDEIEIIDLSKLALDEQLKELEAKFGKDS